MTTRIRLGRVPTWSQGREGRLRGHGVAVAPRVSAAVEDGPGAVVRLWSSVLTQQRGALVDAAAHDQRRFRIRVVAHARHILHVAHVVGGARGDVVAVAFGRRTDALQLPWKTEREHVTSPLVDLLFRISQFSKYTTINVTLQQLSNKR